MLSPGADQAPQLPAVYECVYVERVDSLRETARDAANSGADEGCLLWCLNQQQAVGRFDKAWTCNPGDLHCSILLRPEFEPGTYYQMLIVALVSLGNAIATYVAPMTALGYLWPNDVGIAGQKIASVWLDQGVSEQGRWLAVTSSVNVLQAPDDPSLVAGSVRQAGGAADVTPEGLLQAYAREFIKQINFWSDRGYPYVFNQWQMRLESVGQSILLEDENGSARAHVNQMDEYGNIEVEYDQQRVTVNLHHYMGLK